jgi:glycosyltransferase involved in cell wall biosynthesis
VTLRVLLVHNRYRQRAGEDRSYDAERDALAADPRVELSELVYDSREIDGYGIARKAALPLRMTWSRRAVDDVERELATRPADVVHFHNTFPLVSPAAYRAARSGGARVVQAVRNFRQFCANGLFFRDGHVCEDCIGRVPQWPGVVHRCYHSSASQSAAVVAMQTTHALRRTWEKDVDAYVVPTSFVAGKLRSAGLRGRIVVKPDIVTVDPPAPAARTHAAFVGRLTYEKGTSTLLRAWERLPDVPLVVVGGGQADADVRAEIDRRGLGGRVSLLGETSHAAALEQIARAHFVLIPSLGYETFGRTAVEAYACGTSVIASRIGALAETVVDGVTGILFEPDDDAALAAAVRRLWDGDATPFAERARARYDEVYAPAVVHEQLVRLYEELLA